MSRRNASDKTSDKLIYIVCDDKVNFILKRIGTYVYVVKKPISYFHNVIRRDLSGL